MSNGLYAKTAESYRLSAIFNAAFGIFFLLLWLAFHYGLLVASFAPMRFTLPIDGLVIFGVICLGNAVVAFFKSRKSPES